jgi:predicted nicotinamide N-methyase
VKLILIAGERSVVNVGAVPFHPAVAEALAGATNVESARTKPRRMAPSAFKENFFIRKV